jgi:calcineurin-like phosphoesterase family protein
MSFTRKFFTADLHFSHHGILRYCPDTRPFKDAVEMDVAILRAINDRIDADDLLYILGDFCVGGCKEYVQHLFHSIRCRKILVLGNHDVDKKGRIIRSLRDLPWNQPPTHALTTTDEGCLVHLSHYAHRVWPGSHRGSYHFYGHSHGNLPSIGKSIDVGLDAAGMEFMPKTFNEIRELIDAA